VPRDQRRPIDGERLTPGFNFVVSHKCLMTRNWCIMSHSNRHLVNFCAKQVYRSEFRLKNSIATLALSTISPASCKVSIPPWICDCSHCRPKIALPVVSLPQNDAFHIRPSFPRSHVPVECAARDEGSIRCPSHRHTTELLPPTISIVKMAWISTPK